MNSLLIVLIKLILKISFNLSKDVVPFVALED